MLRMPVRGLHWRNEGDLRSKLGKLHRKCKSRTSVLGNPEIGFWVTERGRDAEWGYGQSQLPKQPPQGSKNWCTLQATVAGPGPLSKLQSRRLYEKWSWVHQWNLSSACICFFTTIWSSISPFILHSLKRKKEKKKNPHKATSITDFKKQDTVKTIRNDS